MYSPEQQSLNNQEGRESRKEFIKNAAEIRNPSYLTDLANRINNLRALAAATESQKSSILGGTDAFIANARAQNEAHGAESTYKVPESGDPRSALDVRMDYKDALTALGGEIPEELSMLKSQVDIMPRDATEAEKRGPQLAFLKAYEEFKSNLN